MAPATARTIASLMLLASMAVSRSVAAQAVTGAGDDAIPVPKGAVRMRIAGQWNDWSQVYADSGGRTGKRPLLSLVGRSALDVGALPQLQATQSAIRTLSGVPDFTLSLGALEARGDVRQSTAPISVELGVSGRLSIGLLVPYVESRDNARLILNETGYGATVGANPAFNRTTGAAARVRNAALLRQIALARTQLGSEITRCAATTELGCEAIRANPAGAQALLARASTTLGALATVYGDSTRGGAAVIPFAGTLLGEFVVGRVSALRTGFEGFGVTAIAEGAAPAGATTAYGPGSLASLVRDSALGLGYQRLGNTRRAGIGDVDLTASYLLFDSFHANQRERLIRSMRALRSMLTLGWRFGTAGADDPLDAFDVPIGDGANALLARSTTDLILNRAFWASVTVRVVKPFADNVVTAAPSRTDSTTFNAFSLVRAERSLGSRIDLEVAPRYAFGDFFGVSAAYLYRRIGESNLGAITADGGDELLRAEQTTAQTTFQAASIGVSFSTLASYVRGRSRLPLEVSYTHTLPVRASGGIVPVVSTDRLELRVYTGFPRR